MDYASYVRSRRDISRRLRVYFPQYLPGTLLPPAPRHWDPIRKAMYYTFSKRCGTIFFSILCYVWAVKLFFRVSHGLQGNPMTIATVLRVAHRGMFAMSKYMFVGWRIRVWLVSAWITAYET